MAIVLSWFGMSAVLMSLGRIAGIDAIQDFGAVMMLMTCAMAPI